MINSISMEKYRSRGYSSIDKEHDALWLLLQLMIAGIPNTVEDRVRVAGELIDILEKKQCGQS